MQVVDGGGHEQRARVAVARDRAGDVDEVHHGAAEDEAERVRVVRQDDLHHLGGGLGGALRRQIHALILARPMMECPASAGVHDPVSAGVSSNFWATRFK